MRGQGSGRDEQFSILSIFTILQEYWVLQDFSCKKAGFVVLQLMVNQQSLLLILV